MNMDSRSTTESSFRSDKYRVVNDLWEVSVKYLLQHSSDTKKNLYQKKIFFFSIITHLFNYYMQNYY